MQGRPATRFIVKGPRGGGKSKILGAIGFAKWFLQKRSIVDMGGSLEQARGVYNYFSNHCYSHGSIIDGLPQEPTMQKTESDLGNYFKAVAASQKQVRGPHPDNLFIDEACETKDELILSALPMINTSQTPLVVMTSTFHKIFGLFQETWDHADNYGWVRYSWDIIDVCKPFSLDVFKNPELIELIDDLTIEQAGEQSLEHRIAGRTGDPEGWVKFESILQAWREKKTLDWFDIEYMGSRPSSQGMVNDPEDVDACIIPEFGQYAFTFGAEVAGGLDWGFAGMTAWTPWMAWKDGVKVQLEERTWSQVRSKIIIKQIVKDVLKYKIRWIYADSSHPFENADLKRALAVALRKSEFSCTVVEVKFGVEKDEMVGNYRTHFQRRKLRILKTFIEGIWQHKRLRYQDNSDKVLKEDDHIPDATMLALKRWPLGAIGSQIPDENIDQTESRDEGTSTMTGGLLDEVF